MEEFLKFLKDKVGEHEPEDVNIKFNKHIIYYRLKK